MRKNVSCPHEKCLRTIKPANAATNFSKPALAVRIAIEKGIIRDKAKILEFGGGNLRNSIYILRVLPAVEVFCFELESTISRFANAYDKFRKLGGKVTGASYGKRKYDIIISTFVLETICPKVKRIAALKSMNSCLKNSGVLVASFRGYSGVRGSRYKKCPKGEGLITPLNTFVKPYSISEVKTLLKAGGFSVFWPLQKYRVEKPENIHLISFINEKHGKKLAGKVLY